MSSSGKLAEERKQQHQFRLESKVVTNTLKSSSTQTVQILQNDKFCQIRKPVLYPIKPYHKGVLDYEKTRAKIFIETISETKFLFSEPFKTKRSTLRMRNFWLRILKSRKIVSKSISTIERTKADIRPFITVQLFNENYLGLLDSGASISCLGGIAATNFLDKNIRFKTLNEFVFTARGAKYKILGYLTTDVEFKGIKKQIQLFIIPQLRQNLYLGVDFFHKFGLFEKILRAFLVKKI